ncbi:Zinc finger and BTB domain-containing protein 7A [Folsomia candida]|uniref:Zinc finger and BTB domain-containing protein 7A n=1 Tax=Folsomia candida TaxID=158441 RepID=A0A226ELI3_FOLCA|nr:Zinc finger and BTB domain-containing protein 7A [Folsomia candida]
MENNKELQEQLEFQQEKVKRYEEVFDAIFRKTQDTSRKSMNTANSVIQEFKTTVEHYKTMPGPVFEPIKVENCLIKTQTGWKCRVCDTPFQDKSKQHGIDHIMIKHMFLQPYLCGVCNISFSEKYGLTKHNKTSHISVPEGANLYTEDSNKYVSCRIFKKDDDDDDNLKSQLYMMKFFKKADKTKKIIYISIDVTTYKDVKIAAELLRQKTNGYDFDPSDVEVLRIYGNNEATGKTLKTFTRVVTKSKCYHLPKISIERMTSCEQTLLDQIGAFVSKMPERNQVFFNTQAWKQQSGEIGLFEPEDTFSPKRAKLE